MSASLSARFVSLATVLLLVPSVCLAQPGGETARPETQDSSQEVLRKLSEIEATQKEILDRLKRIEARGTEIAQASSDFSRVRVQVRSPEEKPLAGYEAKLHTPLKETRRATASGTSDESGLVLDRSMPYGVYNLSLTEKGGWFAFVEEVVVEVGQPLELEVVAPDPALRGKLLLRSGLKKSAFAGLPFGEIRERDGIATLISFTAEPDQTKQTASFPTVENGIDEVAASLAVSAASRLKQPDGKFIEWRWHGPSGRDLERRLVAISGGISQWSETDDRSARPVDRGQFFAGLEEEKEVGYKEVGASQPARDSHEIVVPAGEVTVQVTGVYGQVSEEVAKSLGIENGDSAIWLPVNLQQDSVWKGRIFEQKEWQSGENMNHLLQRSVQIEPGEEGGGRVEVAVGPAGCEKNGDIEVAASVFPGAGGATTCTRTRKSLYSLSCRLRLAWPLSDGDFVTEQPLAPRRVSQRVLFLGLLGCAVLAAGLSIRFLLFASASAPTDMAPGEREMRTAPFITSPDRVVDEMVKLAALTEDDLVYDLGCGDGRIVITAALQSGCRGVGYDIDPERVEEATQNAKEHGVEDRVAIVEQDVFTIDLSKADVCLMYLLPWMVNKLVPQFERMDPGSRIVAHEFWIDRVVPDQIGEIPAEGRDKVCIYLYTIPLRHDPSMELGKPPRIENVVAASPAVE